MEQRHKTTHFTNIAICMRAIRHGLACGLLLATAGIAQELPAPAAESGAIGLRPLVPAEGETTSLTITGEFAFSNGTMALNAFEVAPELVTIDLATSWTEGADSPDAGGPTPWAVAIGLGDLEQNVYDVLVRVNGAQFLFTFFTVEAARSEPDPLPDPAPTVTARRSLGMNLAPAKDASQVLIFVDAFKVARAWIPHRPSDETWDTGEVLDLDERGWVRSLQPDQEAGTLAMIELGDSYPGGRWTVLYEGEGDLDFEWDARVIDREPGRMTLWVTPEEGIHVVIRETNPDNYIRNIRLIMPGHEETYLAAPFHDHYINFLRQFSVLRFMNWADSNEPENNVPEVGEWSQRITPDHASQGTIRSVSIEYMIRLANTVGADPWVNIPIVATDDYIQRMAATIAEELDPERNVYIELSNEVWNPSFPQHFVAAEQGRARGYDDAEAAERFRFFIPDHETFLAALRFHSARSVEMFGFFETAFGTSSNRVVNVMAGFSPDSVEFANNVAEELLDWQDAYMQTDKYAIAPYFGLFLATEEYVDDVETMSVDDLIQTVTADMRFMIDVGRNVNEVVTERGIDLVTYEAGQHMVQASETPYLSDAVRDKLHMVHDDARMFDIYEEYLASWHEYSGLMNLFNDSLPLGRFGLISRWDQSEPYPKFLAVMEFVQTLAITFPGDGDGDRDVDLDDFFLFSDAFGGDDPRFDFDESGRVDFADFFAFVDVFGT